LDASARQLVSSSARQLVSSSARQLVSSSAGQLVSWSAGQGLLVFGSRRLLPSLRGIPSVRRHEKSGWSVPLQTVAEASRLTSLPSAETAFYPFNQNTNKTIMKRQHPMKLTCLAVSVAGLAAVSLSLFAAGSAQSPTPPASHADRAEVAMKEDIQDVQERVHMAAPMEQQLENGLDPVEEARENGFIIEATLEQVEAALAAAATTPDLEDDKRALDLKHRGSYRFYSPSAESDSDTSADDNSAE
jgi:hypothetical protein